jgi:uncharacterized protein (TIGR02391 family)
MGFSDAFPRIEAALELEPEELAPHILRHLHGQGEHINRYNYTLGTNPDLIQYAGGYKDEFMKRLMEAWMWLEREGFVAPRPGSTGDWVFVTRRGERVLAGEDFGAYAKGELLRKDDLDPALVRKVSPTFLRGDYETAVFQAFKEVEVRVRKKAGLSTRDFGVALMRKAFMPGGILAKDGVDPGEQAAEADLFAGAVGKFKNPGSHRDVDLEDPKEAADLIRLANQLLRMVER